MKTNTSKKENKTITIKNSSTQRQEEKQTFKILNNFVKMNDWRSITLSRAYASIGDNTRERTFRDSFAVILRRGFNSQYKLADLDEEVI